MFFFLSLGICAAVSHWKAKQSRISWMFVEMGWGSSPSVTFYSADRLLGVGLRPAAVEGVKLWWLNKGWLTIYSTPWKKNICGEKAPSSPRKLFVSDSLMHFKNNEWGGTLESHPLSHVLLLDAQRRANEADNCSPIQNQFEILFILKQRNFNHVNISFRCHGLLMWKEWLMYFLAVNLLQVVWD